MSPSALAALSSLWRRSSRVSLVLAGLAAMGLLLAWLMGAFRHRVPPGTDRLERPDASRLEVLSVVTTRVPATETAIGTVRAIHDATVASRVVARIKTMRVERAGQPVSQGEVLVELESDDLQAALAQAQAAKRAAETKRDKARLDLARTQELRRSGVASEDKLEIDNASLAAAEAELERAQEAVAGADTMLGYATIKAPITGIVVDKKVNVGDMALPGLPLLTLYDQSRLQLVAVVREELAGRLTVGQRVDVTLDALGRECQGTIAEIVPDAQAKTRSFEVKVVGPCSPGVVTGMFGRLHVPLGERDELRVPEAAIRSVGQLDFVYVVAADKTLGRRFVRLGRRGQPPGTCEVLSGLGPGETIVADAARAERP